VGDVTLRVVQAVFGVFHHFELAHQLRRYGHLERIYTTWPWARIKREGLPHELVSTFPLVHTPEYLLRRAGMTNAWLEGRFNDWNSRSFDAWTRMQMPECDVFVAISGAGRTTGPLVQRRGGTFVCDRGSTHQRLQQQVMAEEYRRWGVEIPRPPGHIVEREEAIYEEADAITVPSTVAKRSFVAMGFAEAKVHVIPYGVRLDRFQPTERPEEGAFDVLFAGQVSLRKGIPYLLEAFARVKHAKKRLTIVGSLQDDLRQVLGRLPMEAVTMLDSIPQAELAVRMSKSHVLALASVEEGLALVQGQAMACGTPVVATRATGAEELFTDGVEGYIVEDRDVDAMAERLQWLAEDAGLRERMSAAGLERVKSLGGWDTYGARWDALLHGLRGQEACQPRTETPYSLLNDNPPGSALEG
jgi:glycosyltransferase involved in cell wall biosynthesis